MLIHCVSLQGRNKIGANVFVSSTHLFLQICMQQLIRVQSARAGECYRPDRNRLHLAKQPSSPTFVSFLSSLPHSVYLPLSHRLCGSAVCCLVTGWSELDIIMTAMLIRPDPIFHLCLSLSGCLRSGPACQMKSARTNKQETTSLHILMELV